MASFLEQVTVQVQRRTKTEITDPHTGERVSRSVKQPKAAPGPIGEYGPSYGGLDTADAALARLLSRHACRDKDQPRQYMVVFRGYFAYAVNNGWRLLRQLQAEDDVAERKWCSLMDYVSEHYHKSRLSNSYQIGSTYQKCYRSYYSGITGYQVCSTPL